MIQPQDMPSKEQSKVGDGTEKRPKKQKKQYYYDGGFHWMAPSLKNGRCWNLAANSPIQGEFKVWYENGQLKEHTFFNSGEADGEFKKWHENGHL